MENMTSSILILLIGAIIFIFILNRKKQKIIRQTAERMQNDLERLRLNYRANGLPQVVSGINLKKNELCHFVGNASFCRYRTKTTGFQGGSRGISIRIAKGLSYRVGNYRGQPIREEILEKSYGRIFITNNRLIFSATENPTVIQLMNIITVSIQQKLIHIQTDKKSYLFDVDNTVNFAVILESLINNISKE